MDTYNRKQEIVNGLIHGIGILFGVSGLPVLTGIATEPSVKKAFKIFDHISIYFLIAGTYTPFLLVYINNSFGITLLAVLWGLTLVGIFFKIRFTGRYEIVSTIIYILMGWIMVVGGRKFFDHLPVSVLIFICIGGGLYSIGVFFYLWDKYTYTHAVWHILVLAAAMCHYVGVLLAM
jgi:hemolysin III